MVRGMICNLLALSYLRKRIAALSLFPGICIEADRGQNDCCDEQKMNYFINFV